MIYAVILEWINKNFYKGKLCKPRSASSIISQRKYSCVDDVGKERSQIMINKCTSKKTIYTFYMFLNTWMNNVYLAGKNPIVSCIFT